MQELNTDLFIYENGKREAALSLLLCEYNPSSVGRYRPSLNDTWIIDYWTNISYLFKKMTGNGNGMGMGMKSLKWEGIGTQHLFPHTSFRYNTGLGLSDRQTDRQTDTTTAYTALAWRRAVKIADSDALSTARFLACREN